ncbi:unnamed protein product, partial [Didymodactylos carnosus]
ADSKYMRAMRLVSGFFATLPDFKLHQHPNAFKLNLTSKWCWFYLRQEQLFLFLQDPTHLVTKWRNRLLSSTVQLCIGQQIITIEHLRDIIESRQYTKLDHNLIRTDINPKDHQKLSLIITTYIQTTTSLKTRLKSAWIIVFVCRLRLAWLKNKIFKNQSSTPINKDKYFITRTAYLSVELNAHNLLFLILLVQQKQLPKDSLHIFLFNSQSCEGMFRNARSLSGAYSTIVNFTTHHFLRHDVDYLDIEQVISETYEASVELIENLGITALLKKQQIYKIEKLSEFIFNELNSMSKVYDNLTGKIHDDDDMNSESDDL